MIILASRIAIFTGNSCTCQRISDIHEFYNVHTVIQIDHATSPERVCLTQVLIVVDRRAPYSKRSLDVTHDS